MSVCRLCPRECSVERVNGALAFCGESEEMTVSRATLHAYEEPSISGERGSGTIFFCGCNLRCVFCQNATISRGGGVRHTLTPEELSALMLKLQAAGAHNINLVTPTHFAKGIRKALLLAKPRLDIPVIYNTSGYEKVETLRSLEGLVDVYLPDFKYASRELSEKYSRAPDYPDVASLALREMFRQVGECVFDGDGMIQKGVIVRHLVLPSCRHDSIAVLHRLSELLPRDKIKLSLMSQYTPDFAKDCEYKNLRRRLTSFEYDSVLESAVALGFDGYFQSLDSSSTAYTPDFESERSELSFI